MSLNLDFPEQICKPEPQESQKGAGGAYHLASGLPPSVKKLHSERRAHWSSRKLSERNWLRAGVPLWERSRLEVFISVTILVFAVGL